MKRLREQFGPNALPPPPKPSVIKQILGQFLNPLVGTLLALSPLAHSFNCRSRTTSATDIACHENCCAAISGRAP